MATRPISPAATQTVQIVDSNGDDASIDSNPVIVRSAVRTATLLATGVISASATAVTTASTGWGGFKKLVLYVVVAAKSLAGGGTVDLYVQTSADAGTTWDDIFHMTQITNAAVANGTYVAQISNNVAAGFNDRAVVDAGLAANSRVDYLSDSLRVKRVSAAFGANDVVTITIKAQAA